MSAAVPLEKKNPDGGQYQQRRCTHPHATQGSLGARADWCGVRRRSVWSGGRAAFGDLTHEPVALTRYGGNVPILRPRLPENLPQGRNILGQTIFLDDHAGPDRSEERVFVERLAAVL